MAVLMWLTAVALGMFCGFLVGREYGYEEGNKRGYVHALRQALEIDRPLYQLCRVLVPVENPQLPPPEPARFDQPRMPMW